MASIWDQAANSGSSIWFNGGDYGQSQDWYNTPVGTTIREQNIPLAFSSWLTRAGVPNTDKTFNRWAYQQQPRFQQAYGMATMNNPLMNIDQFIATLPTYSQLRREFQMQSPTARGAAYGSIAPNMRWLPR